MSMVPKPESILAQAKELLLKTADQFEVEPESWTQGSMAKRKLTTAERAAHMFQLNQPFGYQSCDLYDDKACMHCMVGKLYSVNIKEPRDHNYGYSVADAAFLLVRNELEKTRPEFVVGHRFEQAEPKHIAIEFNDSLSTKVTDVINLLRSAAA